MALSWFVLEEFFDENLPQALSQPPLTTKLFCSVMQKVWRGKNMCVSDCIMRARSQTNRSMTSEVISECQGILWQFSRTCFLSTMTYYDSAPNFTYGLLVYGAVDSDLTVIRNFLDRSFKRKYTFKRMDIRELLEKADKKIFKVGPVFL